MAKRTLPGILKLIGFWPLGSNGWNDEMDANLFRLSVLAQCTVESRTKAVSGFEQGKVYIVPANAESNANYIAAHDGDQWRFIAPDDGLLVTVLDEAIVLRRKWGAWMDAFYDRSNAVGTVTLDSEGKPTGALFERVSGTLGRAEKRASGFCDQIVSATVPTGDAAWSVNLPVPLKTGVPAVAQATARGGMAPVEAWVEPDFPGSVYLKVVGTLPEGTVVDVRVTGELP
ncbi:hypothetical protein [Bacteriophage Phobos]|uniref:Tail fiber protein n=1 Tax=Bacteriophage Phobos TaxID=2662138 RepID=A0A5Q2U9A5_9CAUD|nr:hypothetical protein JT319_gp39 [Bacteriophage Phobos]QGH45008.1 hypothetical protein [Bacteriophage Phobos]WPK42404.1 hypothetical protein [Pseudomonas phage Ppu-503]